MTGAGVGVIEGVNVIVGVGVIDGVGVLVNVAVGNGIGVVSVSSSLPILE